MKSFFLVLAELTLVTIVYACALRMEFVFGIQTGV